MKQPSSRIRFFTILALSLSAVMLLVLSAQLQPAAQAPGFEWDDPLNMSRSGSASAPRLIRDSEERLHLFWEDAFAGIVYTTGDGESWSDPAAVLFPFGTVLRQTELIADSSGFVHAFWLADDGTLFHSWVFAANAGIGFSWTVPLALSRFVGAMSVDVGPDGRVHLAFVKTGELDGRPAGIYYRYADPAGFGWSVAQLLDQSPYFRGRDDGSARVRIAAGAEGVVYAAWDNRLLERIFLIRSADRGATWLEAQEMDGRQELDSIDAVGPSGVELHASGDQGVLLWNAGHDGARCNQYFQASGNRGETWSGRQLVAEGFQGCPNSSQLLDGPQGSTLLLTNQAVGVFLLAWDGARWSTPQLQPTLTGFVNSETFRDVIVGCHNAVLSSANRLFVAGCDAGVGEDIWLMSRPVGSVASWYPTPTPTSLWNPPFSLRSGNVRITSPKLLADSQGGVHAFWSQNEGEGIYYARKTGAFGASPNTSWSNPVAILRAAGGSADQPDASQSRDNRIFVVWNANAGELQFSTVEISFSLLPARWSDPQPLPSPRAGASFPAIALDQDGQIFVIYAIPFNEKRGIYLVRSTDQGRSWSEPAVIFDAEAAGWEMVDRPQLTVSQGGSLHVFWERFSFSGHGGLAPSPLELYYAASENQGETWSEPSLVSSSPPLGSQILAAGERTVFRTWSVESNGQPTLFYDLSNDDGASWSEPGRVSELGNETALHSLVADQNGIVHLLQVREGTSSEAGEQPFVLQRAAWEGQAWGLRDSFDLGLSPVEAMAAAIAADNSVPILYVRQVFNSAGEASRQELLFTDRSLPAPQETPTPLPSLTPQPAGASAVTATPETRATPTRDFPTSPDRSNPAVSLGTWGSVLLGLAAAGFLILLMIVFSQLIGRRRAGNR